MKEMDPWFKFEFQTDSMFLRLSSATPLVSLTKRVKYNIDKRYLIIKSSRDSSFRSKSSSAYVKNETNKYILGETIKEKVMQIDNVRLMVGISVEKR